MSPQLSRLKKDDHKIRQRGEVFSGVSQKAGRGRETAYPGINDPRWCSWASTPALQAGDTGPNPVRGTISQVSGSVTAPAAVTDRYRGERTPKSRPLGLL